MVQVIDDPYAGNVFGRIGKGIGKGLSDQIPKEVDRQRLSSGLKKIGQSKEKLDPYEQASQLASLPGGLENFNTLYPLIQQGQQRKAFLGNDQASTGDPNASTDVSQPALQTREQGQPAKVVVQGSKSPGLLASPDDIRQYKGKQVQEPTFQQQKALAKTYLSTGQVQTPDEAMKLAGDQIRQDITGQNTRKLALKNDLSERMALDLQKSGLGNFQDVAGEIQQRLLDEGEYLVFEKGLTPQEASHKISAAITDLGKAATQTKTTGSLSKLFSASSKSRASALREQKKVFDKYGFGEIFDDLASSAVGITPMKAASILDPVHNEDFSKALKKIRMSFDIGSERIGDAEIDKLAKTIKPEDNILSMAEALRDRRIDVTDFLEKLRGGEYDSRLTEKQKRQLQKPTSNSFFGDILFSVF